MTVVMLIVLSLLAFTAVTSKSGSLWFYRKSEAFDLLNDLVMDSYLFLDGRVIEPGLANLTLKEMEVISRIHRFAPDAFQIGLSAALARYWIFSVKTIGGPRYGLTNKGLKVLSKKVIPDVWPDNIKWEE